jgi:hypothetical protein
LEVLNDLGDQFLGESVRGWVFWFWKRWY